MDQILDQLGAPPYDRTVLRKIHDLLHDENTSLEAVALASLIGISSLPVFRHIAEHHLLAKNVAVRIHLCLRLCRCHLPA